MTDARNEWLTARQMAKMLTSQSDFEITDAYVRRLAHNGKLEVWRINTQMSLYSRTSGERYLDEKKKQPQRA